jgi:hypothetical protein
VRQRWPNYSRARITAANITFFHGHEQELAQLLNDMQSGVKK